MAVTVAFDTTPLHGPRTGIGVFTAAAFDALRALPDGPVIAPYVVSYRAHDLPAGTTRLALPAGLAVRLWGRIDHPRGRRIVGSAEVVHGTNYIAPPTGRPTVLSVHDASPFTHPERCTPVVARFAAVVRRAVTRGAFVHTHTPTVARLLTELLGTDRVQAIAPGAPVLEPGSGQPLPGIDGRPYVLALATKEPRKNLPRLVTAFGLVAATEPDLVLALVGSDGGDGPAIAAAIAALPRSAAERVVEIGFVHGRHRTTALQQAQVLAFCSLDEGFGFPVLEAFTTATPVVATTAGSVPDVAGDAALLVDPTDTEAIAAALTTALTDTGARARLVEAGRGRLAAHDWATTARGLATLYGEAHMSGHQT